MTCQKEERESGRPRRAAGTCGNRRPTLHTQRLCSPNTHLVVLPRIPPNHPTHSPTSTDPPASTYQMHLIRLCSTHPLPSPPTHTTQHHANHYTSFYTPHQTTSKPPPHHTHAREHEPHTHSPTQPKPTPLRHRFFKNTDSTLLQHANSCAQH